MITENSAVNKYPVLFSTSIAGLTTTLELQGRDSEMISMNPFVRLGLVTAMFVMFGFKRLGSPVQLKALENVYPELHNSYSGFRAAVQINDLIEPFQHRGNARLPWTLP